MEEDVRVRVRVIVRVSESESEGGCVRERDGAASPRPPPRFWGCPISHAADTPDVREGLNVRAQHRNPGGSQDSQLAACPARRRFRSVMNAPFRLRGKRGRLRRL